MVGCVAVLVSGTCLKMLSTLVPSETSGPNEAEKAAGVSTHWIWGGGVLGFCLPFFPKRP